MGSKKAKKARKPAAQSKQGDPTTQQQGAPGAPQAAVQHGDPDDELAAHAHSEVAPGASQPPPRARGKRGSGKPRGVLALFDHPDRVLQAAEKTRGLGYQRWDVFTPFPVHGMDEAMGLGKSKVPWITFLMGFSGLCAALVIQFGTMVFSWPLNFGGKPAAAWPSFVPITFEMTVFAAGVSTAVGALLLGGVLRFRKPKLDRSLTSHRFGIFVEAKDPKYDEAQALNHFEKLGAVDIRVVKEGE